MWDDDEIQRAEGLCHEISHARRGGRRSALPARLTLPSPDTARLPRRTDSGRFTTVVQHLLHVCCGDGVNDLPDWRLEHKLVQALVLRHFCPEVVPVTRGLAASIARAAAEDTELATYLQVRLSRGWLIKPSMGYGSGERAIADQTDLLLERIRRREYAPAPPARLDLEEFIVQERLAIAEEYRVHSFEDRIVELLTAVRYPDGTGDRKALACSFVQSVIDRLPEAMVRNALCGWDVALTSDGRWMVIEVNVSGHHRVHDPGFHCSGFLNAPPWGALHIAKWMAHIERLYATRIDIDLDAALAADDADSAEGAASATAEAYRWVAWWRGLLRRHESCDVGAYAAEIEQEAGAPLGDLLATARDKGEQAFYSCLLIAQANGMAAAGMTAAGKVATGEVAAPEPAVVD